MKKRFFAGLLTAVLLVSMLPVSAFASEDEQNSGLTAAEQTETTQAAEMPEAELDIPLLSPASFSPTGYKQKHRLPQMADKTRLFSLY